MKTQYTILHHGKTTERSGRFETLDEAKKAVKSWGRDPMLQTAPMELLPANAEWQESGPAYLRTLPVVKFRTVARYFTGNPDTNLSIREEVTE